MITKRYRCTKPLMNQGFLLFYPYDNHGNLYHTQSRLTPCIPLLLLNHAEFQFVFYPFPSWDDGIEKLIKFRTVVRVF